MTDCNEKFPVDSQGKDIGPNIDIRRERSAHVRPRPKEIE